MAYIYQNSAWAAYDTEKYVVNTTTFTTYPFTIKSPTTPVNATIYGNMQQTGTPTPTNPIQPQECGDLETTGEHADQYKIPILSNSTTNNVYLGEVQSTRKIKKLIFSGTEIWTIRTGEPSNIYFVEFSSNNIISNNGVCSHYINQDSGSFDNLDDKHCLFRLSSGGERFFIGIRDSNFSSVAIFKSYLQQQYANGTPITVWYVLAETETATQNEPIRKIGDYADTVTTSIPVIINSDTVDIATTLKPSAVSAPSLSWSAGDDYKRSSGAWD